MASSFRRQHAAVKSHADLAEPFRLLAESTQELVWVSCPDGRLNFVNRRWTDYTGLSLHDGWGRSWKEAIHPDDLATFLDQWTAAVARADSCEIQVRLRRRDGVYCWFHIRAEPALDHEQRPICWVGTCTDSAERKPARPRVDGDGVGRPPVVNRETATRSTLAGESWLLNGGPAPWAQDYAPAPINQEDIAVRHDGAVRNISACAHAEPSLSSSEARYRAIVESQAEMVCRFQPDGTILFVNGAYARSRGTTPESLIGASFWDFVEESDRAGVRAMLDRLSPDVPEMRIENRFETLDGVRWTLWTNRGLSFDAAGRVTEVQSAGMDITDRKQAEETVQSLLRISKRLNSTLDLDSLLEILVQEAIALVGAESGLSGLLKREGMVCTKYLREGQWLPLEYCWPPMHGLPGWLIVHKVPYLTNNAADDPQIVQELCRQFGVRSALSTPIVDAKGEVIGFFEIHNKRPPLSFTPNDQELLGAVAQTAAIAIQNAIAYRQVQQAEESLREADRRKDEFLATLAHELRNPLAPIRTGLDVMKLLGDDPAGLEEIRATMERQTEHLITLVNDLLEVSRITRGKLQLRKREIDLAEVVQAAVEASRPFIDAARHELVTSLPDEPIRLLGDPHRLAQVLANLLNNAAKYTPEGGRIWLSVQRRGRNAELTVKDTGVGIPAEMHQRIFEMFAQVDSFADRATSGLGIGLTLAKSLVEMHGGSIHVCSEGLHAGSEFTVCLPALVNSVASNEINRGDEQRTAVPACRVMVVDDNEAAADMLCRMIKMFHCEVRVAHDGQQAVQAAAEFLPDVILMDLGMPKMDGYEAARRIRELAGGHRVVMVAVSGRGQEEDKQRSREAGFNKHLVKPADIAEVREALGTAIARGAPAPN